MESTQTIPLGEVATIDCPAGKRVLAGGYASAPGVVLGNAPTPDGSGWGIRVGNAIPGDVTVQGYAICADV
ncbi:hypothetical protein ACFP8W_00065 [Nocardioides hankookensis]